VVPRALDSFSTVSRASGLSSCFALPDALWAVPRAPVPVLMFCALGIVLGGTEGERSSFHVLRSRTHFRRYRGRWVPFAFFLLSDSFSTVLRASSFIFIFCAPVLFLGGT
jgi:hypothetical protein